MDKNFLLSEYIKTYPALYSWLYFNVILNQSDSIALLTDSDNVIQMYIDGSTKREYVFNIVMSKFYDTGENENNLMAMSETQNLNEWIKQQNLINEYDFWGDGCIIDEIEVLTQVPLLSIDQDQNIVQYSIQLKVHYIERNV